MQTFEGWRACFSEGNEPFYAHAYALARDLQEVDGFEDVHLRRLIQDFFVIVEAGHRPRYKLAVPEWLATLPRPIATKVCEGRRLFCVAPF